MTFSLRSKSTRTTLFTLLAVCLFLFAATDAFAQRNVCYECKTINKADATNCKNCMLALNLCLDCNTENPADKDFCINCNAPLAEMRVLGRIASETREQLRLGQSERARIEKELMKIAHLLKQKPEDEEKLTYKRAMLLHRMNFFSREAETWREFISKFPESKKKSTANAYLSVALRKWGYLFYSQKNKTGAATLFEEATKANPMNHDAWNWLGRVRMEAGKTAEAKEAYLKSLEANPGDKTAIHFLKTLKATIPAELLKPRDADVQK
ncbi:MAG: tetratricopeptide repeat protein [Candidatus Riflebacteria bacterium]|nr:tetratricopeptide repeat protein [Candidatus Riflebacteria bacterium]